MFLLKLNYLPDFRGDFAFEDLKGLFVHYFLGFSLACRLFLPNLCSLGFSQESSATGSSLCAELPTKRSAGGSSTGWVPG